MIAAAFLMLAQMTPVQPEPKPVMTTIVAIRANPGRFNGKLVRLHGWVNSCIASSCAIDERARTALGGAGESLSIAPNPKFDDTIRPLLPTYVEFDATVDSSCLLAKACAGRAPVLNVVTLRGVVSPEPPEIQD